LAFTHQADLLSGEVRNELQQFLAMQEGDGVSLPAGKVNAPDDINSYSNTAMAV